MHSNQNQDKNINTKVEKIRNLGFEQNKCFRQWAKDKDWQRFHNQHYDWWTFPINQPSSRGDQFQLLEADILTLKNDSEYIKVLSQNCILACRSWGWDLQKGEMIKQCDPDQQWQDWPIRLKKLCHSLELFQQKALFKNSIKYGNILLDKCGEFYYGKRNLTGYFRSKQHIESKI